MPFCCNKLLNQLIRGSIRSSGLGESLSEGTAVVAAMGKGEELTGPRSPVASPPVIEETLNTQRCPWSRQESWPSRLTAIILLSQISSQPHAAEGGSPQGEKGPQLSAPSPGGVGGSCRQSRESSQPGVRALASLRGPSVPSGRSSPRLALQQAPHLPAPPPHSRHSKKPHANARLTPPPPGSPWKCHLLRLGSPGGR